MAGTIIARAIHEGDDTWRLFAPFELVWAGGGLGRAAAQVRYWFYRWGERLSMRQARRREAERRRGEERELVAPLEDEPEREPDRPMRPAAPGPADAGSVTEQLAAERTKPRASRRPAKP
jgi:2Fe-2S ferredoxin